MLKSTESSAVPLINNFQTPGNTESACGGGSKLSVSGVPAHTVVSRCRINGWQAPDWPRAAQHRMAEMDKSSKGRKVIFLFTWFSLGYQRTGNLSKIANNEGGNLKERNSCQESLILLAVTRTITTALYVILLQAH